MVEDAQHQGEGKVPLSSDFDAWVHFISLTLVLFVFFFSCEVWLPEGKRPSSEVVSVRSA